MIESPITVQGSKIGSISRICASSHLAEQKGPATHDAKNLENLMNSPHQQHPCWISHDIQSTNVNGPMPIMVRDWMKHEAWNSVSTLVFVSSHNKRRTNIQVVGMSRNTSEGPTWKNLNVTLQLNAKQTPCKTLHSPSIFVDDEKQQLLMYIHGHGCQKATANQPAGLQPTVLFASNDGVSWDYVRNNEEEPYLLQDSFYLSVPVYSKHDGYFYAMAKTQENKVGSAVLYRSKSITGPFEKGPIVARGIRHVDLYLDSNTLYVFFTLIGDMPERVLLGSIDISNSEQWMHWNLLPGPTLLQPEYFYEHGNAKLQPSESGAAKETMRELRDPRFLPDNEKKGDVLSGYLFYTVQGEQGIALARLTIDLERFRSVPTISYRNRTNISPSVLKHASLEDNTATTEKKTALFTGVGRSGTTALCNMFQSLHLNISHDNHKENDCGPSPGSDGAASWYDAFRNDSNRTYSNVLHLVRNPLKVVKSRALKCGAKFLRKIVSGYEKVEKGDFAQPCYKFALKNWVRRNSFVEKHASWRVRTEDLDEDKLSLWNLCMAGHFGPRCPTMVELNMEGKVDSVPKNINTGQNREQYDKIGDLMWDSLLSLVGPQNEKYVKIAQAMSFKYGYESHSEKVGNFESMDYDCWFTEKVQNRDQFWDCFLTSDNDAVTNYEGKNNTIGLQTQRRLRRGR